MHGRGRMCRGGSTTRMSWSPASMGSRPGASSSATRRARPGEHEGQREGSLEVLAALAAIRRGDVERSAGAARRASGPGRAGASRRLADAARGDRPARRRRRAASESSSASTRRVVRLLIERSADLDGPLNLAACFNRAELVRMLLDAGADPAPDPCARAHAARDGALPRLPAKSAELLAEREISPLALWSAAALGRVDLMARLLGTPEAVAHRPNLADVGWPPGAAGRGRRADDPGRGALLRGAERPGRGSRVADRARREPEREPVPRRDAAPFRGAVLPPVDGAAPARRRRRPDAAGPDPRRNAGRLGASPGAHDARGPDRGHRHRAASTCPGEPVRLRSSSAASRTSRRRSRSRARGPPAGLASRRGEHRPRPRRERQPRRRRLAPGRPRAARASTPSSSGSPTRRRALRRAARAVGLSGHACLEPGVLRRLRGTVGSD